MNAEVQTWMTWRWGLFLCRRHNLESVRLLSHGKSHVWGVSCLHTRRLQWILTVNEITICNKVKKKIKIKSSETWSNIFPVLLITLPPACRRRWRCPESPPSFLVDSTSSTVCFWEFIAFSYSVLILWWDWFLIIFPNFCASDFSMRLLRDNQVEWPSEQYFLIC